MATDYQITVYKGFDSDLQTLVPYEKLDIISDSELYYSGFFDMVDLPTGLYTAVTESKGYLSNFVKFAISSKLVQGIKPFPVIPRLEEGQLALLLTWSSYKFKDLDLHVEFIGSQTIQCKVDFT